jgi:hypothetical protein
MDVNLRYSAAVVIVGILTGVVNVVIAPLSIVIMSKV